ncbi:MAG: UvrB/UvrC motif-containing protein [Spirochaetia bacterium]
MKCDVCGKGDVVMNIQQILGEKKLEIGLCQSCANKYGISKNAEILQTTTSELLQSLLQAKGKGSGSKNRICPRCTLTLKEFKKYERLGCTECFNVFKSEITAMLRDKEMGSRHTGKFPNKLSAYKTFFIDRERIRKKLETAIAREDYERAAKLRDRLTELDQL